MVTVTPEGLIDNSNGQYDELGRRRAALLTVSDPSLVPLRDTFVAAIDQARKKLEPGLALTPDQIGQAEEMNMPRPPAPPKMQPIIVY